MNLIIDQNVEAGTRLLLKKALARVGLDCKGAYDLNCLAAMAARSHAPIEDETDRWVEIAHVRYGLTDIWRDTMIRQAQEALRAVREVGA